MQVRCGYHTRDDQRLVFQMEHTLRGEENGGGSGCVLVAAKNEAEK